MPETRPLNTLNGFGAPVGGLFRHGGHLAGGQIERGHRVGLIADSRTGGQHAEESLSELAPRWRRCRLAAPKRLGRVMVVPSCAEGLPYVDLEATAADKPLIASWVGGISEIYGPLADGPGPARKRRRARQGDRTLPR